MARIKIDGTEYDFPTLDSLTLDEAIVLERQGGVGIERLEPGDPLPVGVVKALIVIAIRRVRPDATEKEIAERIGQLKLTDLQGVFAETEEESEGDAGPPAGASDARSESTASSGASGSNGGEPTPAKSETPPATGPPVSDTGPASVPATSGTSPPVSLTTVST